MSADPAGRRPRPRLPYLLIAPSFLALLVVLGYPLVDMVTLAFQDMTRKELFSGAAPPWAGLGQFRTILGDGFFWTVVARTALFTVVCVSLTMALGLIVALLMRRTSPWVRAVLAGVLVAVWAMPVMVAAAIFRWLFDADYGLVNWLMSTLPGIDLARHNWFTDPWQGFAVITAVVVWGALPFAAVSLHAALTQIPPELEEAALIDGARPSQLFRYVTFPAIKPLFVMVTTLMAIWDFGVFNQIWLMRGGQPEREYYLLGVYSFIESFAVNRYSTGAAIALVTVVLLLAGAVVYLRQMLRLGEAE
ncbi:MULTISPECIES: sugar ABC transporter permease [unclassified Streptomyces]|uniref:carbohydrate ABC transporter permease n=1 Tax=unclassified Streptomyces TaxID=2593676 RepID=UPI000F5B98BC|nr:MULTISPECIES: sugar ABC transporter permease [unclassified Streptomyces]WSG49579.1 sugar ABC transporter permease [Streptomyces sp. NBC_01732]WSX00232.1 sugar ABC transporter permease [Streptomyces sp. NBC_00987]MCX4397976.1 sugar ABC transporter permease [Streptomyces sp. NBC_01767]MCX5099326.1 sugar ABC transporter permease [Streptomyces sp. NBC_00439]MCX5499189.1 sugar ABC transporter permease [Streptomyces sp. NBC_00052]